MNTDIENFNKLLKHLPILEKMNVFVESYDGDSVTTKVPMKGNTNHLGTIYAGVIFSLAEFIGVPLMTPKMGGMESVLYIMKEMSIRYRRPATTDLTVTVAFTDEDAAFCKAGLEKDGKVDFLVEMEIKDTTGEVVALTKNLYHLRKP